MADEYEVVEEVVSEIAVHPLNYIADRRREYMVVVDRKEKEAWLMLSADVPGDFEFALTVTELAKLPKPYGFEDEIKQAMPSTKDVQRAFWIKGIVTKDDLADVDVVKNALATVLPSANLFARFRGE